MEKNISIDEKKERYQQMMRSCIPAMMGMLLSGIYSIVDGLFIGKAMQENGLAAINIAWPVPAFYTAWGVAIGAGCGIELSKAQGRGEYQRIVSILLSGCMLQLGVSILGTLFIYPIVPNIMHKLGAAGEVYTLAVTYGKVIAACSLLPSVGAAIIPILRNLNRPVEALIISVAGMITNCILNAIFIFGMQLGIFGAALGTVCAQSIVVTAGCAIVIHELRLKNGKHWLRHREKTAHWYTAAFIMLKHGVAAFGLSISPTITLMITNAQCQQYGGTEMVACYAVISYVTFPVTYVLMGVGDGTQPLFSYYMGAGKAENIRWIQNRAICLVSLLGVLCMAVVWANAAQLGSCFGLNGYVLPEFVKGMRISASAFVAVGIEKFFVAYMNGIGKRGRASAVIYLESLFIAPLLMIVLPSSFGKDSIWYCYPCTAWLILLIMCLFLLFDFCRFKKYTDLKS